MKIGFVGAGRIAGVHARHLRGLGITDIAAYDPDPARASALGRAKPSEAALIADADIVVICTPSATHRAVAERALTAGKGVFIEKPIALSTEDADAIADLERAGGFVAVGQVARFFPAYAAAHARVAAGVVGRVAAVRMVRSGGFPGGDGRGWYGDHAVSGGVFVDLGIHDFDWLLWTLGPAIRVFAHSTGAAKGEGPDHGLATVTFTSGALAHVESSWMERGPLRTSFDIAGSDGLIEFDSRLNATIRGPKGAELSLSPGDDPYAVQWRAILDAHARGVPAPVGAEAGAAALALAAAARTSAQTGMRVDLR